MNPSNPFDFFKSSIPGFGSFPGMPGSSTGPQAQPMDFARMMQTGALPTNLEELGQRIDELKTVEQWLSFNLQVLRTTIQGMEVQQGTLQALKSMQDSFGSGFGSGFGFGAAPSPDADRSEGATDAGQAWWDAVQKQFSQMAVAAQAFHAAGTSAQRPADEPANAGAAGTGSRPKAAGARGKAKGHGGGKDQAAPGKAKD